jgi:hypothetical protein
LELVPNRGRILMIVDVAAREKYGLAQITGQRSAGSIVCFMLTRLRGSAETLHGS